MTTEDYQAKLDAIEAKYRLDRNNLFIEYATSIRKFGIGDIIKNGDVMIRIDRFKTMKYGDLPEPQYCGPVLKKDFTERKDGARDTIFYKKGVLIKKAEI